MSAGEKLPEPGAEAATHQARSNEMDITAGHPGTLPPHADVTAPPPPKPAPTLPVPGLPGGPPVPPIIIPDPERAAATG